MAGTAGWANRSGGVTARPRAIVAPASEEALVRAVREAGREDAVVRVVGRGHSFVPLCATGGLLLSLDGLQGVVATDPPAGRATARAGTKISRLGAPSAAQGRERIDWSYRIFPIRRASTFYLRPRDVAGAAREHVANQGGQWLPLVARYTEINGGSRRHRELSPLPPPSQGKLAQHLCTIDPSHTDPFDLPHKVG